MLWGKKRKEKIKIVVEGRKAIKEGKGHGREKKKQGWNVWNEISQSVPPVRRKGMEKVVGRSVVISS